MERRLSTRLDDFNKTKTPISLGLMQEKAVSLFQNIRKEGGERVHRPPKREKIVQSMNGSTDLSDGVDSRTSECWVQVLMLMQPMCFAAH